MEDVLIRMQYSFYNIDMLLTSRFHPGAQLVDSELHQVHQHKLVQLPASRRFLSLCSFSDNVARVAGSAPCTAYNLSSFLSLRCNSDDTARGADPAQCTSSSLSSDLSLCLYTCSSFTNDWSFFAMNWLAIYPMIRLRDHHPKHYSETIVPA